MLMIGCHIMLYCTFQTIFIWRMQFWNTVSQTTLEFSFLLVHQNLNFFKLSVLKLKLIGFLIICKWIFFSKKSWSKTLKVFGLLLFYRLTCCTCSMMMDLFRSDCHVQITPRIFFTGWNILFYSDVRTLVKKR